MQTEDEDVSIINSPLGSLIISTNNGSINKVQFSDAEKKEQILDNTLHTTCAKQLSEYFEGKRKVFDLPIQQSGTPFRQKVWQELLNIPFGETISYLELSRRIGDTKAIRAVGSSNGKNNVAIIIPCHRVIGSDNKLTGYAGGLWRKEWLLKHELQFSPPKSGLLF